MATAVSSPSLRSPWLAVMDGHDSAFFTQCTGLTTLSIQGCCVPSGCELMFPPSLEGLNLEVGKDSEDFIFINIASLQLNQSKKLKHLSLLGYEFGQPRLATSGDGKAGCNPFFPDTLEKLHLSCEEDKMDEPIKAIIDKIVLHLPENLRELKIGKTLYLEDYKSTASAAGIINKEKLKNCNNCEKKYKILAHFYQDNTDNSDDSLWAEIKQEWEELQLSFLLQPRVFHKNYQAREQRSAASIAHQPT